MRVLGVVCLREVVEVRGQVPDARHGLSERELEVLRLVAAGHTDREIAGALAISRRTATTHLTHILDKLGLDSRTAPRPTPSATASPEPPAPSPPRNVRIGPPSGAAGTMRTPYDARRPLPAHDGPGSAGGRTPSKASSHAREPRDDRDAGAGAGMLFDNLIAPEGGEPVKPLAMLFRGRRWLLAAVVLSLLLRVPFFGLPMISDEGGYAYVAERWLDGRGSLYHDLWVSRPQGIFVVYGADPAGARLLASTALRSGAWLASVLTLVFVWRYARQWAGRGPAAVAALTFALDRGGPAIEGFTANAEVFMALPSAAAAWLLLQQPRTGWSRGSCSRSATGGGGGAAQAVGSRHAAGRGRLRLAGGAGAARASRCGAAAGSSPASPWRWRRRSSTAG